MARLVMRKHWDKNRKMGDFELANRVTQVDIMSHYIKTLAYLRNG